MTEYIRPKTLGEAIAALEKYGERARVMAGGTDLLPLMRRTSARFDCLVDITAIGNLSYIEKEEGLVRIGALQTHSEVEESHIVRERGLVLAEACGMVGCPQVRNRGTVVGNIMNASPAADSVVALIVLGGEVKIFSRAGNRFEKIENIFLGPGKTAVKNNELITELRFKALQSHQGSAFFKLGKRRGLAVSIVNSAVVISLDRSRTVCRDAKIALGAVGPRPVRAGSAERILIGQRVQEDMIEKAALAAKEEVTPIDDIRGSAEYRREMVKVLAGRAIRKAIERARNE